MSPCASGDTLDSATLNLRAASAITSVGFSTNTLVAESGSTISTSGLKLSGALISRNPDGSQLSAKPLGDGSAGLINWISDDTQGYLLHLTTGPNAGGTAAAIGIGVNFGGQGILIHNYATGNGIYLQNDATSATAFGLYGRQVGAGAPLIHGDQIGSAAAPLLSLWGSSATNPAPRLAEFFTDYGTTLAGWIHGLGYLCWASEFRIGGATQGIVRAYDQVNGAWRQMVFDATNFQFYSSGIAQASLSAFGDFQIGAGTALQPSLAFFSETSLGMYRSAASTIKLSYGTLDTSATSILFGNIASSITTAQSGATAKLGQGQLYFSVLSNTTNGGEFGFRSGNTVYRFASVGVG